MSLFIGGLAYGEGGAELGLAKIGILVASLIAAIGGVAVLRSAKPPAAPVAAEHEAR